MCENRKWTFSEKHPKNRDTKQAHIFTSTVDFSEKWPNTQFKE